MLRRNPNDFWFPDSNFPSLSDFSSELHPTSLDASQPTNTSEDPSVRKLQAFLSQSEQVRKEASVRFTMDGLQLVLFSDMDEVSLFRTLKESQV